jgi:1-aminocyclopropane-1-carboxylate deaminase
LKETLFSTDKAVLEAHHFAYNGLSLHLLIQRDDLIDELVSGNKWRKLKYNIYTASHQRKEGVLTFGGAYSNHLVATAKAASLAGLKSIGIVRGEELNVKSNTTLMKCHQWGMQLKFVCRSEYAQRYNQDYLKNLRLAYSRFFLIPEGGANYYGLMGCVEIAEHFPEIDHVFVAMGTGTTAAGLRIGLPAHTKLHIVSALKGNADRDAVLQLIESYTYDQNTTNEILGETFFYEDMHGGYGKWNQTLIDLVVAFYQQTGIKLDLIYTGKVLNQLLQLVKENQIDSEAKILIVHTGGVQGVPEGVYS